MTDKHIIEQARTLFTFGQKIRHQIIKAHLDAGGFVKPTFGENLSPTQTLAIMKINTMENCTISKLAKELNVSAPSASAMVDRLVEKQAVERVRSTQDRRKVVVSLSQEAHDYAEKFEQAMLQSFVKLIETIGPELTDEWCKVVGKVDTALTHKNKR